MKRITIPLAAVFVLLLFSFTLAGKAQAEGSVPIADNLELVTRREVPVEGLLSARDAENGKLSYQITTNPIKGTVQLEDDGRFFYTPRKGKKGRDYFGYRATDAEGNVSQEATVLIRIEA